MAEIASTPQLLGFWVPRLESLAIDVKYFFKSYFENEGGRLSHHIQTGQWKKFLYSEILKFLKTDFYWRYAEQKITKKLPLF